MNPKYASALGAAAATQPNLASDVNGNSSQIQHLQNLAAIQFRAGGSGVAQGAFGGEANATVDAEAAARAAAQAEEERKLKLRQIELAKQEAENDPKNYTRAVSADGGYDFYNAKGEKIDVREYSRVTGKQIPTALEGSTNPKDAKFAEEYKSLMNYGKALAGDDEAVKAFKDSEAGKKFLADPNNKNMAFGDVVAAFNKYYSSYLQPNQLNQLPTKNSAGEDITGQAADTGGGALVNWLTNYRKAGVQYRG